MPQATDTEIREIRDLVLRLDGKIETLDQKVDTLDKKVDTLDRDSGNLHGQKLMSASMGLISG